MVLKKWTCILLILICSAEIFSQKPKKNLLTDIALTYGITSVYVLIIKDLRENIFTKYSLGQVMENFKDPINRAIKGGKYDTSTFLTNYVGHPLSFAGLALYLKDRGYNNFESILFTQLHSIMWEYVIEGGIWYPSGKDLISDLIGALAGIYLLHPLSNRGEKKLKMGNKSFFYYFLYYLNPFKEINKLLFSKNNPSKLICVTPKIGGFSLNFIYAF